MRYNPALSVIEERVFSMRTSLAASTVTPGRTAPDGSLTVPVIEPCANTVEGRKRTAVSRRIRRTSPPIVEPGELVLERKFDAADVVVVGVVDLGRHAPDRRGTVANHPCEKTSRGIEVQGCEKTSRAASLNGKKIAIADAPHCAPAPVAEGLFDLPWKTQLRFQARPVQLAADQLVLAEQAARRPDPASATVERPCAEAAFGMVLVRDQRGPLI